HLLARPCLSHAPLASSAPFPATLRALLARDKASAVALRQRGAHAMWALMLAAKEAYQQRRLARRGAGQPQNARQDRIYGRRMRDGRPALWQQTPRPQRCLRKATSGERWLRPRNAAGGVLHDNGARSEHEGRADARAWSGRVGRVSSLRFLPQA